jgi:hypothetical protein
MKRYLFFLVLFVSFTQVLKAQRPDPLYLKDAYRKGYVINSKDSSYYQRLFFKALPSNFKTFNAYYGWDDKDHVGRSLTGIPPHYFNHIFNSTAYSRAEISKKIIGISVNGVNTSPAVSSFQRAGAEFATDHNAEFIRELKTLSKPQIVSVWKFFFDYSNAFLSKTLYEKLHAVTARNDKQMELLMTEGYKKAQAKWAAHR